MSRLAGVLAAVMAMTAIQGHAQEALFLTVVRGVPMTEPDPPLHEEGRARAEKWAEVLEKAGIDAVSFGGTKNGLMGVEAAVIFDQSLAWEFELRRKRGAHLFSKHRFLAAQMEAYLADDLWLDMASSANAACAALARGLKQVPGTSFNYEPQANIIFADWARSAHKRLHEAGAQYNLWAGAIDGGPDDEPLTARLVTDWSATDDSVRTFIDLLKG